MTKNAIYFITGSSGAGKTTLLRGVVKSVYPNLSIHHFDDLGVPSLEEMKANFGGAAQWQAHNARQWIEKVAQSNHEGLVVLEGQARPTVIFDAADGAGLSALHITLIDCSHAERRRRLIEARSQPELDNLDTYAWAAYLRGQAEALKLEIIDTTIKSLTESVQGLASSIAGFAKEEGLALEERKDSIREL